MLNKKYTFNKAYNFLFNVKYISIYCTYMPIYLIKL